MDNAVVSILILHQNERICDWFQNIGVDTSKRAYFQCKLILWFILVLKEHQERQEEGAELEPLLQAPADGVARREGMRRLLGQREDLLLEAQVLRSQALRVPRRNMRPALQKRIRADY